MIAGCVHRRVVQGSGVGSAGCVVHVDVHGAWVMHVVGGCNLIATEHAKYSLSCMYAEAIEFMSSAKFVWSTGAWVML